jgi:hypothetical protein
MTQVETSRPEVRPFRIDVPDEELVDLRQRILATRWPERETVADESLGVPLATIQELAGYWATDHGHAVLVNFWTLSHGVDVDADGNGSLRAGRLYHLVREHDAVSQRTLEITFLEPGVEAHVITFG